MLRILDDVGRAITPEEEAALLCACLKSRSRSLYLAVTIALNTGMRYGEIRLLQWKQVSNGRQVKNADWDGTRDSSQLSNP
jgi:integrase